MYAVQPLLGSLFLFIIFLIQFIIKLAYIQHPVLIPTGFSLFKRDTHKLIPLENKAPPLEMGTKIKGWEEAWRTWSMGSNQGPDVKSPQQTMFPKSALLTIHLVFWFPSACFLLLSLDSEAKKKTAVLFIHNPKTASQRGGTACRKPKGSSRTEF